MKIKYRIKQIGEKFYPQYRILGIWLNINVPTCITKFGSLYIDKHYLTLCFDSLSSAKIGIDQYENNYILTFKCRGHKVKTFYNKTNNQYVYVDMATVNERTLRYNNISERLCEEIAEYEDKLTLAKKITIHELRED